jgi:hypothetical protein
VSRRPTLTSHSIFQLFIYLLILITERKKMSGGRKGDGAGGGLGKTLQGLSSLMQMQFSSNGNTSLSNDFFNLIKGIGEAKSKLVPNRSPPRTCIDLN